MSKAVKSAAAAATEEVKSQPRKKLAAEKTKPTDKTGEHPLPKKTCSPWLYFNMNFTKKFVEDGGKRADAFKAAGARWKEMTEEEKQPFEAMSKRAEEMREAQIEELKKKGYYTLEDGSKSTDDANKSLFKIKKKRSQKTEALSEEEESKTEVPILKAAKKAKAAAPVKEAAPAKKRKTSKSPASISDAAVDAKPKPQERKNGKAQK